MWTGKTGSGRNQAAGCFGNGNEEKSKTAELKIVRSRCVGQRNCLHENSHSFTTNCTVWLVTVKRSTLAMTYWVVGNSETEHTDNDVTFKFTGWKIPRSIKPSISWLHEQLSSPQKGLWSVEFVCDHTSFHVQRSIRIIVYVLAMTRNSQKITLRLYLFSSYRFKQIKHR